MCKLNIEQFRLLKQIAFVNDEEFMTEEEENTSDILFDRGCIKWQTIENGNYLATVSELGMIAVSTYQRMY